jgi:hypothetical protein
LPAGCNSGVAATTTSTRTKPSVVRLSSYRVD